MPFRLCPVGWRLFVLTAASIATASASPVSASTDDTTRGLWQNIETASSNGDRPLLAPQDAFPTSAWHDGTSVYVGFDSALGHYLYRDRISLTGSLVTPGTLRAPQGQRIEDEFFGDVDVLHGPVVVQAGMGGHGLDDGPVSLNVSYQGCSEAGICYPPESVDLTAEFSNVPPQAFTDALSLPFSPVSSDGQGNPVADREIAPAQFSSFASVLEGASLPLVFGMFFLAGLALTFTPCVLPMLPILSSIVVGRNVPRPRALKLSGSYVAGMVIAYTVVGIAMGIFGGGLNIQAYLQSPPVLLAFAGIFVVLALAMMGRIRVPVSATIASRVDRWQSRLPALGLPGTALAGALSVLVVSPCVSAPLAGVLVFISATGNAILGGAALFSMALGMGLPLIIAGTLGTTLLPRNGEWLETVKAAFGYMLLGVAIWLIARLVPEAIELLLWAALLIALALNMGIFAPRSDDWKRYVHVIAVAPMLWGIALAVTATTGQSPLDPLERLVGPQPVETAKVEAKARVHTLSELREALEATQSTGDAAFVNVTADWCPNCKVMERRYMEPDVAAAMAGFTRIDVDITENTPATRELLSECGLFGPPGVLFFQDGHQLRNARISGEVGAHELRERIMEVKAHVRVENSRTVSTAPAC